jgi:hypothetical protein
MTKELQRPPKARPISPKELAERQKLAAELDALRRRLPPLDLNFVEELRAMREGLPPKDA